MLADLVSFICVHEILYGFHIFGGLLLLESMCAFLFPNNIRSTWEAIV